MKLSAISKTMIAPLLLTGAISCNQQKTDLRTADKAKENAMQYLTAEEFLYAENRASNQPYCKYCSPNEYNPAIIYWDSITSSNKIKEAYSQGKQMIRDSIANKPYTKPDYKIPNERIIKMDFEIKNSSMRESSRYYNAIEFNELREREPNKFPENTFDSSYPNVLHYWNLVARAGAERKAFNDGANAERAKLNK